MRYLKDIAPIVGKVNKVEIVSFTPHGQKIGSDLTIESLENARRIVVERINKPLSFNEEEAQRKLFVEHFKI